MSLSGLPAALAFLSEINFFKLNPELFITGDGSHSLFLPELKEYYHSRFGAITESRHIFIQEGFLKTKNNPLSILEVGFGTGLNAYLTYLQSEITGQMVLYTAIEKHPLPHAIVTRLNYPALLEASGEIFFSLHLADWKQPVQISNNFSLIKQNADLLDYTTNSCFDLVYFDAFGPDVQPLLWSEIVMAKIASAMKSGGILTTYSCKGSVRRALEKSGLRVEKIPGPPGKREMVRALKE